MDEARMLRPEEAARMLGIGTRTLSRYAEQGQIPVVILPSGQRRYREADVIELLRSAPRPGVNGD